jgi:hypothetical protein
MQLESGLDWYGSLPVSELFEELLQIDAKFFDPRSSTDTSVIIVKSNPSRQTAR